MRNLLWAALLSSSALATGAAAQTSPTATPTTPATPAAPMAGQPTATLADCDRLTTFLEQRRPANPGVTVDQIRTFRTANNAQACRDALVRLDPAAATTAQGAGTDGRIVVQQTAPSIRVEQAPPQVSVQQAQPTVNVRQGVPEIIVRQPPPTITVQMPNPEIIVRMPEPEVNVAMAQPQVSVTQPRPDVQVVQPAQPQVQMSAPQQPQVNVSAAANQAPANIQVDRAQPKVTFERQGEAKIVMNQAEGQPQIRVEQAGRDGATPATPGATTPGATPARTAAMTPATGATAPGGATTASTSASGPMTAARVRGMDLYSQDNQKLGDVDRVIQTTDGKSYLLVGFGGFLGIGERKVAIPVEQVAARGDRLVVTSLTNDQLKALPAYDASARGFRDAEGTYSPVFGTAR